MFERLKEMMYSGCCSDSSTSVGVRNYNLVGSQIKSVHNLSHTQKYCTRAVEDTIKRIVISGRNTQTNLVLLSIPSSFRTNMYDIIIVVVIIIITITIIELMYLITKRRQRVLQKPQSVSYILGMTFPKESNRRSCA